jgi:hypothetical protein
MHDMRMIFDHRYRLGDQFLDVPEKFRFFLVAKGKRDTTGAGSTGSAYAMYIRFRYVGQLIVDDVCQLVYVDAPGGDIRRDQYPRMSALEILQCLLPGVLRLVAMDSFGADACPYEALGDLIGAMLGTREYQGCRDVGVF